MKSKKTILIFLIALIAVVAGFLVFRNCWPGSKCGTIIPTEKSDVKITEEGITEEKPVDIIEGKIPEIFTSKEECEKITKKTCNFQMCDSIPTGETPDVCAGQTGWAVYP